ncbi:hypothetical protein Poli38472_005192 [Pythium oligandrum]|uniref:Protein kinase domain-containing protein n=1 Tax=Pythium oligandrum TaxID=41045 RepID=A0A8K1CFL2_PYTOL|nr:hypothetical protein Poli38472_005192 [Pythium oligandrum]|eukprot:TMW62574.1 hypothetical protein Poli38472_005192 [Pythium oligandrum]
MAARRLRHLLQPRVYAEASVLAPPRPPRVVRDKHDHSLDGERSDVDVAVVAAMMGGVAMTMTMLNGETKCEALFDNAVDEAASFEDEYEAKTLVGCGTFGMVMQCVSKRDGHIAAVKMIEDQAESREEVAREKEALSIIEQSGGHENIVRYDGSYQHDGFHFIVTEFLPGDSLFEFMQKRQQLDLQTSLQLCNQLVSALTFLRDQRLIHRDLKPENIIVVDDNASNDLKLKIIDFGSAERVARSKETSTTGPKQPQALTLSGTKCYWPPEVLTRQETSPAMDMWALGCIMYIMICGRHPFDIMGASSEAEIIQRILTCDSICFFHPQWVNVPEDVKNLIRGLLEKDPAQRLTVEDLRTHPGLQLTVL